jgi:hypothetical protein
MCWILARLLIAQMSPMYTTAIAANPALAAMLPGLTALLHVKKTIAHKGVSTKKANSKEKAAGKQPTHGKVGKKATKAAAKTALAEKLAAASQPASPPPAPVPAASPAVNGAAATSSH